MPFAAEARSRTTNQTCLVVLVVLATVVCVVCVVFALRASVFALRAATEARLHFGGAVEPLRIRTHRLFQTQRPCDGDPWSSMRAASSYEAGQAVLAAGAAYAAEQLKAGGWKAICDSVAITIASKTTHLSNMDLSGVAMGGSSDSSVKSTNTFVLPSCTADPNIKCGACNCDAPTLWPASLCNVFDTGCGAKCDGRCCNMHAGGSAQYAFQLGVLTGIDKLFGSATSTACAVSADLTALVATVTLANSSLSMANVLGKFRLCTPVGNITRLLTINAAVTVSGTVTLNVPFSTTQCSTTLDIPKSILDCSGIVVNTVVLTVNGSSLATYLEDTVVPLCVVLGAAIAALCAAAIPFLLNGFQTSINNALANVALKQIPPTALQSVSAIKLPMPCVFCPPPPSSRAADWVVPLAAGRPFTRFAPFHSQQDTITLHSQQVQDTITLPPLLAPVLAKLLSVALNSTFTSFWKSKWNNYTKFPYVFFSPTMFVGMTSAVQVDSLVIDAAGCVLDLTACTMQLSISSAVLQIPNVSVKTTTTDVLGVTAVTFACVVQTGVDITYDPNTGGTMAISINKLPVTSAGGTATSSPSNTLSYLVNALLQAPGFAACLASFALAAVTLPMTLSTVNLDKNLPIPNTVCSGTPSTLSTPRT